MDAEPFHNYLYSTANFYNILRGSSPQVENLGTHFKGVLPKLFEKKINILRGSSPKVDNFSTLNKLDQHSINFSQGGGGEWQAPRVPDTLLVNICYCLGRAIWRFNQSICIITGGDKEPIYSVREAN